MDGLVWTVRVITAAVLGTAVILTIGLAAMVVWLFGERDRSGLRPWERDIYSEELNK